MLKYIDDIFESLYGSKYNSDGIAWSTYYSYEIKEMDNDYHSYIDIIAFHEFVYQYRIVYCRYQLYMLFLIRQNII